MYWVDQQGNLREGEEELGRRYGYREATEEDLRAHNERLATEEADTKGTFGLIAEGFERGLSHIQDLGAAGFRPPPVGSDAFGPGGGALPSFGAPAPVAPLPRPGAETFPEATSDEARLRTKAHPVLTGIGTGLAAAPFAAIGSAAGGTLGAAGTLASAVGAIGAEALVEAAAQEYDDAWLEQRPYELKNVVAYTAMFALGDVILRGGAGAAKRGVSAIGEALTAPFEGPPPSLGGRNIVAEAQARAEGAGRLRPAQSVGAASARDLAEPFDEALSTMTDRDAMVLARDADDHYHLVARDAADELTRIHRGLTESLGSHLKYEDFKIGADAWSNKTLERQSEWIEDVAAEGQMVVNRIRGDVLDYGNAGKLVAKDIETYSDLIMNEADGAQRNYLVDQLKKRLDKRIMDIAADFRGDPHARKELLKIIEPFAGGPEVRGMLRDGLENAKYWGHNAELQKALNAPWHDLLTHWRKFQEKLYEASGEVKFAEMGAGRTIMEATAERVLSVLQKDTRLLQDLGRHVAGTFDGYQRLIEARQSKGIVGQGALPGLDASIRNLMEDWNLGATLSVAKARAENAAKNPRNWHLKALDLAEKAPFGVGTAVGAARAAGRLAGDLHIKPGTALADVWDAGLKRYAQNPTLADTAINQAYSDWMQAALRQRGAPIPDRRTPWGGIKDAAASAGGKVAGASLFGLGAAATQQPEQLDENGQPVKQAGAGPLGLMGLGLAMMFRRKGSIRVIGERARRALKQLEPETVADIDQAIERHVAALGDDLMKGTREEVSRIIARVKQDVHRDVEAAMKQRGGGVGGIARKITDLRVEQTFADAARSLPEEVLAAADTNRAGRMTRQLLDAERSGKNAYDSHPLEKMFGDAGHASTTDRIVEMRKNRMLSAESLKAINDTLYRFGEKEFVKHALDAEEETIAEAFEDAVRYQVQHVERAMNKEGAKLSPAELEYLRLRMKDAVELHWTFAKRAPVDPLSGAGARVRHGLRYVLKDAERHEREVASGELGREKTRAMLESILKNIEGAQFRPGAAAAIAADVVDEIAQGRRFSDAVDELARAINEGAENTPLTNETHRASAGAFRMWEPTASADLGFSVRQAIDEYAGDFDYKNINAIAREGAAAKLKPPKDSPYSNTADILASRHGKQAEDLQLALDYAIDHGYTAPGRTWRGVLFNDKDLARLKETAAERGVAEAHAFMSTTTDAEYALRFIERKLQLKKNPRLKKVIFEVIQRTGVPVNPQEAEVLLRAGTRFQIEELPVSGREHARFRATELETEPRLPSQVTRGAGGDKALPWIAGGVFALGSMTAADKAAAGELPPPPPDAPDAPDIGPSAPPSVRYREALRSVASGAPLIIQRAATSALRRTPPAGRDPLRAFVGRRSLDAAVDSAREAITRLQGDPESLIAALGGSTGDLARTHPSLYMALVEKAAGIVAYLSANAPQRTGKTLLDPEGMPPSRDRSVDFVYKVVGAAMPRQAMADIARLDAPPEELAAFQQNWGELWEGLRLELLGQIQRRYEAGRPVDSERLRKLDGLLGMNGQLDPSASVEVAQHIIASAEAAPAAPGAGNSAPTGAPSPTGRASGRLQTRLAGLQMESTSG